MGKKVQENSKSPPVSIFVVILVLVEVPRLGLFPNKVKLLTCGKEFGISIITESTTPPYPQGQYKSCVMLIAFQNLSRYIQKHLSQSMAVCGKIKHKCRPRIFTEVRSH